MFSKHLILAASQYMTWYMYEIKRGRDIKKAVEKANKLVNVGETKGGRAEKRDRGRYIYFLCSFIL